MFPKKVCNDFMLCFSGLNVQLFHMSVYSISSEPKVRPSIEFIDSLAA